MTQIERTETLEVNNWCVGTGERNDLVSASNSCLLGMGSMLMKLTYSELKDSKKMMMNEHDIRDYRKSI